MKNFIVSSLKFSTGLILGLGVGAVGSLLLIIEGAAALEDLKENREALNDKSFTSVENNDTNFERQEKIEENVRGAVAKVELDRLCNDVNSYEPRHAK